MELSGKERVRIAEEIKQLYIRIVTIIFFAPFLVYLNSVLRIDTIQLNLMYVVYIAFTSIHYLFIKTYPEKFIDIRRYIISSIDIVGTTILIDYLGYYGFVFNLFYLWIILGNLLRFGEKHLIYTIIFTELCLIMIYIFNPYWKAYPDLILYTMISVIFIPLFVYILIKQLIKENRELSKLLQLVEMKSKIDSLTKIHNRLSFEIEIKRYMSKSIPFALLFIDIDGFKSVNDNYGHDMGDEILKEIADRIRKSTDKSDFVARLGGDEFVVMSLKSRDDVLKLAERLCKNLSQPYGANNHIDNLSASIGISYFPEDTTDEFMLKRYADIAMYAVKQSGKHGFVEYCPCWKNKRPMGINKNLNINHCKR